jgi:hypothetical protein
MTSRSKTKNETIKNTGLDLYRSGGEYRTYPNHEKEKVR